MVDLKKIGKRFRKLREYFGLSIEEMAQAVQESPETIRNIEEGKQSCSLEILCKYAEHFEVSLNWLVLGVGPMFLRSCKPMMAVGDGVIQVEGNNNIVLR